MLQFCHHLDQHCFPSVSTSYNIPFLWFLWVFILKRMLGAFLLSLLTYLTLKQISVKWITLSCMWTFSYIKIKNLSHASYALLEYGWYCFWLVLYLLQNQVNLSCWSNGNATEGWFASWVDTSCHCGVTATPLLVLSVYP